MNNFTDITFELFNYCNGSCTGCALSSKERKIFDLHASLEDVFHALDKIKEYSNITELNHRVIFSFGDIPKLDWHIQKSLYEKCLSIDLAFGLTLTLVDETFDYLSTLQNIYTLFEQPQYQKNYNQKNSLIFDLTVDPTRIKNLLFSKKYCENIKATLQINPDMHVQVLLSNYVMSKFSPEILYNTLSIATENKPVLLSFSPTLENLEEKKRYHYSIDNAFEYAKTFYNLNPIQKHFLDDELSRFYVGHNNMAERQAYAIFARQTFHINYQLDVFPVSYTIYGDIIRDTRNNLKPLGNLKAKSLINILNEQNLMKLNIKNSIAMENSPFDCIHCQYFESCSFNGIGLVRHLYKNFEEKVGNCYGPINLQ